MCIYVRLFKNSHYHYCVHVHGIASTMSLMLCTKEWTCKMSNKVFQSENCM